MNEIVIILTLFITAHAEIREPLIYTNNLGTVSIAKSEAGKTQKTTFLKQFKEHDDCFKYGEQLKMAIESSEKINFNPMFSGNGFSEVDPAVNVAYVCNKKKN